MTTKPIIPAILPEHFDALLVGNGVALSKPMLRALALRSRQTIAMDGGARSLRAAAIAPDFVVGDLDSVDSVTMKWARDHGSKIIKLPDQEGSDLAKSIEFCRAHKFGSVVVTGIVSQRVDHTQAALQIVSAARRMRICILTANTLSIPIRGTTDRKFPLSKSTVFSWIPLSECYGCTLNGAHWSFQNRTMKPGGFYSLSNVPICPEIRIRQRSGISLFTIVYNQA